MARIDDMNDSDLLKEFSESGSHAAFAALVKRHGSMVHAVSMRVVSNHHDAQDVTQATFIVLAREAAKLSRQPTVAGWLHTVSRRLSLNARKSRENCQRREQTTMNDATSSSVNSTITNSFRRELDASLESLPERYLQPLVLFHLEGAPLDEVARRLSLNPSTLRTRLARARDMLRRDLMRRGVEVASVGAMSALFVSEAKAAAIFTPALHSAVLDAATSGGATLSPHILHLAGKASVTAPSSLTTLIILMKNKAAIISAVVVSLGLIGTTVYISKHDINKSSSSLSASKVTREGSSGAEHAPRFKRSIREKIDPLSKITSDDDLFDFIIPVLLIVDSTERLEAIRNRLGMNISDEVYQKALKSCGYQINADRLLRLLWKEWMDEDPRSVMAWSLRFGEGFGMRKHELFFIDWLAKDSQAALAYAEEINLDSAILAEAKKRAKWVTPAQLSSLPVTPQETVELIRQKAAEMAAITRAILDSAADPVIDDKSLSNHSQLYQLKKEIWLSLKLWSQTDPKAAMELMITLNEEVVARHRQNDLIGEWAIADPDAALAWATELSDDVIRAEALVFILPSWQLKHPDQNLDLSMLPADKQYAVMREVMTQRAVSDPTGAMDYAMSLENGDWKKDLVSRTSEMWAMANPNEATAWAIQLPAGDVRDISLSSISSAIGNSNFASAQNLAREIQSEEVKQKALTGLVRNALESKRNLPDALRLAGELPKLDIMDVSGWADVVRLDNKESIPAFRTWLQEAHAAGRIEYHKYDDPESAAPAEVEKWEKDNAKSTYEQILKMLD